MSEQAGVRPTIVLVHSAFADASSSQAVTGHILKAARAVAGAPR
jgi:hypothetical protein